MTVLTVPGATGSRPALLRRFLLRWTVRTLVAVTWGSAAIFAVYILAHYGGAALTGTLGDWNRTLPRLYEPGSLAATLGVGLHFAAGAILLLLGPVQLLGSVRRRFPAFHRWSGRVYAAAAVTAGAGGLGYIALKGTVGGLVMNLGFGLYGALTVLAAVQAVRHARAGRFERHRAWAVRLFALAIGSWLYRMYYGFWSVLAGGAGHTSGFDGPFDMVMAFFFYVPNLLAAELFIRAHAGRKASPAMQAAAVLVLAPAAGFLLIGTYYFTRLYWGPGILAKLPAL